MRGWPGKRRARVDLTFLATAVGGNSAVVVAEGARKDVVTGVAGLGDKEDVPGGQGLESSAEGLKAWVGDWTGREAGMLVGVVGAGVGEV